MADNITPQENKEKKPGALEQVLIQYLNNFMPAASLDEAGAFLRTSEDIQQELEPMLDIDTRTIAIIMIGLGYKVEYQYPHRIGWLMKYKATAIHR